MSADYLSEDFIVLAQQHLKQRLHPKRYSHSLQVARVAVELAEIYGVDVVKAHVAGLLHDWDKEYDDDEIRQRARDLQVEVEPYVFESMPRLLHGLTAAKALAIEFPGMDEDILRAIARHTSGAIGMSGLDMVVYVADVIEPGRPYPAMDALRASVGRVELEELFLKTYKQVFSHLVEQDYRVHPDTVSIWNHYIMRARKRSCKGGTA